MNNGYRDVHDMKRDYNLDSKSDIFVDKATGDLYAGPRRGQGSYENLGMKLDGS